MFTDAAIVIHDACCTWSGSDEKEWNMVLNHVTLDLPKGSFVAVIGEVSPAPEAFQDFLSSISTSFLFQVFWLHNTEEV